MIATASQTVGPFFHVGLAPQAMTGAGGRIQLVVQVVDGEGAPVPDALIEFWQPDAKGEYHFARLPTDASGQCAFDTIYPGQSPGLDRELQAPHINVHVFARGVLWHLFTRIYFAGDPANGGDAILNLVPQDRRDTLLARPQDTGAWSFHIHLCGESETVFFDA